RGVPVPAPACRGSGSGRGTPATGRRNGSRQDSFRSGGGGHHWHGPIAGHMPAGGADVLAAPDGPVEGRLCPGVGARAEGRDRGGDRGPWVQVTAVLSAVGGAGVGFAPVVPAQPVVPVAGLVSRFVERGRDTPAQVVLLHALERGARHRLGRPEASSGVLGLPHV